jgi:hypothetical protein
LSLCHVSVAERYEFAYKGIAEGSKQRKSFNHILCKNFDGIGPSGSANGYEAFEAQILKL